MLDLCLTGVVVLTFLFLNGVFSALFPPPPYSGDATMESKSSYWGYYLSVLYALVPALVVAVMTLLKLWNSFLSATGAPTKLLLLEDLGRDLDRLDVTFFLETVLLWDAFLVTSFSFDLLVSIARLALAPRLLNGLWWIFIVSSLLTANVSGTLPGERTNSLLLTDGLWFRSLTERFEKSN